MSVRLPHLAPLTVTFLARTQVNEHLLSSALIWKLTEDCSDHIILCTDAECTVSCSIIYYMYVDVADVLCILGSCDGTDIHTYTLNAD